MFVKYHDEKFSVIKFKKDTNGVYWIDLGIGFWVNADHVEIVSE